MVPRRIDPEQEALISGSTGPRPFVTVVIPILNEERFIVRCLESLLSDPYPRSCMEIIVADGGSTDRTVEVVEKKFPYLRTKVRVVGNPKRLQSGAFNAVMKAAYHADCLLRCDAHAVYPPYFISRAVRTLERHPEVGAVVASARTILSPDLPPWQAAVQAAVAYAQSSWLGVGGSTYRLRVKRSGYVEHGWHGLFGRAVIKSLGGYDEAFRTNEDAELSLRIRQAGWKIWLGKKLQVGYFPRSTLGGLARQYWAYGKGRAATVAKHAAPMKFRQLAPVAAVILSCLSMVLTLISPFFLLPLVGYLAAVMTVAGLGAVRRKDARVLLAALVFPVMHYSWGAGFIWQSLSRWLGRERTPA